MSNGDDDTSVRKALPVDQGTTVKRATPYLPPPPAAPAAPTTPASTWDQTVQNAAPQFTGQQEGRATVFATPTDLKNYAVTHSLQSGDNGVGHPAYGGVDTAHSYGIAVPKAVMAKLYGGNPNDSSTTANWRTARAQVTVGGKTYIVPISDDGPKDPATLTDLTSDFMKGISPDLMGDKSDTHAQVKLLPAGSGPDILKEPDKWHTEQQGIGKQLIPTPLGSPDIVRPPQPPRAQPVLPTTQPAPQTFTNPASGDIEPVQTFAKGGFVQPIQQSDDDEDDPAYHWPDA